MRKSAQKKCSRRRRMGWGWGGLGGLGGAGGWGSLVACWLILSIKGLETRKRRVSKRGFFFLWWCAKMLQSGPR